MTTCPRCGGVGEITRPCPYEESSEIGCEYCGICTPIDCPRCEGEGEIEPDIFDLADEAFERKFER